MKEKKGMDLKGWISVYLDTNFRGAIGGICSVIFVGNKTSPNVVDLEGKFYFSSFSFSSS